MRPGERAPLAARGTVVLEDGTDLGELDHLPPGMPPGIHELVPADGSPAVHLLVSPGRCHLPAGLRAWGVTMQVPTTRSRRSWGIGDLADVRTVATWLRGHGGSALGLSPLHAPTPVTPVQPSPYYPSSRRWRNPLLLRIDEVPGAEGSEVVGELAAEARRMLDDPIVDRDRCWALQRRALEHLWTRRPAGLDAELGRWRHEHGEALERWARFCALAEQHGPGWSRWPAALRRPESAAVSEAAEHLAERVAFHAWLQWLLERQLDAANVDGVRLVQDLAIGVDPDGGDAWSLQDLLATGVTVGAPPDDFAPDGQDWGLPPFIPWRLRDVGYRPLAELLRASMSRRGGLRVDHVMGLSRLFWIPEGGTPADGTYVRFPGRELLDVLALESDRAEALVVGEDLGTVEDDFRAELERTGVLSTRLVWFEDDPPDAYPEQSLGMVTTHDLPTIAGLWTGADEAELAELGRPTPPEAAAEVRQRLDALVQAPPDTPVEDVAAALHARLARGRSALVLATLEDLCGAELRPNVPGTTSERPNWSLALPCTVEDLGAEQAVIKSVRAMADARPTD